MKTENVIESRSMDFSVRIVNLYKHLCDNRSEYVLSKQLLRCGTSVGANVREALRGQSRKDFVSKMNIALKEICEAEYWIELLHRTNYLNDNEYESIFSDCKDIVRLLMSIVKTSTTSE